MLNTMCSRSPRVQERRGEEPPRLARRRGRRERQLLVTAGPTYCSRKTTTQMPMIVRVDDRPAVGDRPPKTVRAARTVFAALAHAVDALDADRGRPLALRADRALAALAADVGLAVGVPRADRHRLRAASGSAGCSSRRVSRRSACRSRAVAGQSSIVDALDDDGLDGRSMRAGRHGGDRVDDVAARAVGDLAEDRVLAVSYGVGADGDEELRAVGALAAAGVGHGEQVGLVEAAARGGSRRRTCSPGRRCRCRAGSRPGS